ncbi:MULTISPECIES: hypothetical protein [Paenibacillus]|uniref:Uncharacterized protein n=1 Tax=Paenibacillus agri TaxID=2744309 RepID=A0A850EQN3_9BACL|nr:hypothetical protein [Paenibacillus agri]NUU61554.1 hypothetical protein [Paenibacillus agri]
MGKSTKIRKQAKQLQGRPVCITLHDGRSYVGFITGLEKEALVLSRPSRSPKSRKKGRSRSKKAEVSGFMPLLGSLFGGGFGSGEASGGLGGLGFFGMIQKTMPLMKMGYNMIKTIRPFIGELKGLMG